MQQDDVLILISFSYNNFLNKFFPKGYMGYNKWLVLFLQSQVSSLNKIEIN